MSAEPANAPVLPRACLLRLVNLGRAVIALSGVPGPACTTTQVNPRGVFDSNKPREGLDGCAPVAGFVRFACQGIEIGDPGEHAGRDLQRFRQTENYRTCSRPAIFNARDCLTCDSGTRPQLGCVRPACVLQRRRLIAGIDREAGTGEGSA
jgi:hypothetical protein